jgi:hypothetical protein
MNLSLKTHLPAEPDRGVGKILGMSFLVMAAFRKLMLPETILVEIFIYANIITSFENIESMPPYLLVPGQPAKP